MLKIKIKKETRVVNILNGVKFTFIRVTREGCL